MIEHLLRVDGPMEYMLRGGPTMWAILLLAIVIAILTLKNAVRLFVERKADAQVKSSVNAILFWGAVAVFFGWFGQWNGLYKMASIVVDAPAVNPDLVVMGFWETLVSAIAGLAVFLVAAPCWFVLHARCRALRAAGSRDPAVGA